MGNNPNRLAGYFHISNYAAFKVFFTGNGDKKL
jgi:hypothetical protein